ncbi:MAG: helix-turn-helix transcriptional regulator [Saprospiraceae bacterium]|nr:helix-turn-helix transcriptional regulator [Saprospiraceae bacterium]
MTSLSTTNYHLLKLPSDFVDLEDVLTSLKNDHELCNRSTEVLAYEDTGSIVIEIPTALPPGIESHDSSAMHEKNNLMYLLVIPKSMGLRLSELTSGLGNREVNGKIKTKAKHPFENDFSRKIQSIIAKNYSDTAFTVEVLAKEIHLSRTQLYRRIKEVNDQCPQKLITKYRIEKGCELLASTEMPITSICYASGFSNPSHFCRVFRKHLKMSPRIFRQKYYDRN